MTTHSNELAAEDDMFFADMVVYTEGLSWTPLWTLCTKQTVQALWLVDTINNSFSGDGIGSSSQSRKGRTQISFVNNVADDLPFFDYTGPLRHPILPNFTIQFIRNIPENRFIFQMNHNRYSLTQEFATYAPAVGKH